MLDLGLEGSKQVGSPGARVTADVVAKDSPLEREKITPFRAIAARGNYLAMDRPDAQFSCKEICRWMSSPTASGVQALKRLGRYLEGHRRVLFEYPFQSANTVEVYSDTDWAGCVRTRKSTSGGCLLLGRHMLKSWSSTQASVSLSSGEAEFYGVTKAAGIGLGFRSLLADVGVQLPLRVWTDSSAALGICGRQGLGKLRHIDTRSLWIQQKLRSGDLVVRKVRGEANPADLFTKHLPEDRIRELLHLFGCRFTGGRAAGAPLLRRELNTQHQGVLAIDLQGHPEGRTMTRDGYVYKAVQYEDMLVPEAYMHDEKRLPHRQDGDLALLFPQAVAAQEPEDVIERMDWLEARGSPVSTVESV